MSRSRFIAGLVGPLLLAIATGILLNGTEFRALVDEFSKSLALVFLTGLITLVAGLAIIRVHNVWTSGWEVIVTIFGWLAVIGGLARVLFPRQMAEMAASAANSGMPSAAIALIPLGIGAFLTWKGWRHES